MSVSLVSTLQTDHLYQRFKSGKKYIIVQLNDTTMTIFPFAHFISQNRLESASLEDIWAAASRNYFLSIRIIFFFPISIIWVSSDESIYAD